jgi:hypothetical protein
MLLGAALLRFHAEAIAAIAAKTDEEIPQGLSKAALIAQFEALVLTHFRSTADGGCGSFSVTSPCRSGDSRYAFSMDFNIPSGNVVADLDEAHQIMGFEAISVGAMHDIQCQLDTVSWVTRMRIGTMSGERAVIRRARQADADGTARVHIASADDALAPLARQWPASDINRRTEQWVKSLQAVGRLDMVATVADQVVGFIGGGPPRQQDIPGAVEIYVIHVLPTHRCAGVGGQLWDVTCTTLRGPALAPLYLETLAELPCCAFYDVRGGEVLTRAVGTFYGGEVTHLAYYWPAGKPHERRP